MSRFRRLNGTPVERAGSLTALARVLSVGVAAGLLLRSADHNPGHLILLVAAAAHSAARAIRPADSHLHALADTAVVAAMLGPTGGPFSPFLAYAFITVLANGFALGIGGGALAGIAIAFAAELGGIGAARTASQVGAWFAVFPLIGLAGGMATRIWNPVPVAGARLLGEANTALSDLHRIAQTMPVGLEPGSIAESMLEEIEERLHPHAAAFLLVEGEAAGVVKSFGLEHTDRLSGSGFARVLSREATHVLDRDLLDPLTRAGLAPWWCWLAAPLRRRDKNVGLLIVACNAHTKHAQTIEYLTELAGIGAVAIENAALFARVRDIAVGEERRRFARELHDGVAQALTHLRFELDGLARSVPDEILVGELKRLSKVADRALADTRSTMRGLRAGLSESLAGSLRSYVSEMRGFGQPQIELAVNGDPHLPSVDAAEVFRVAQEAVSNALRHADASHVYVALDDIDGAVQLTVEDDGRGMPPSGAMVAGIGLSAMRERAERIRARLQIESKPSGGTRVTLACRGESI